MATIRAVKVSGDFVIMHKGFLKDPNLSAKAKGVMAYILSLPDDWQIRIEELATHFTDGRDSIRKAINELEKAGYIEKVRVRGDNGKFKGWEYLLYENPNHKTEKPNSENPISEKPNSENPTLLINDNTNNENTNNKNKLNYIAEKNFSAPKNDKNKKDDKNKQTLKTEKKEQNDLGGEQNFLPEQTLGDNAQMEAENQSKGVALIEDDTEREKILVNQIIKLFAKIFYDKTELKLPQKEFKKIGGVIKKKFVPVMLEFAKQEDWTDDDILYRTTVIILYHINQNKLSPEIIFGKPAEIVAEIRQLQNTKNPQWKYKLFISAKEEAEKYLEGEDD